MVSPERPRVREQAHTHTHRIICPVVNDLHACLEGERPQAADRVDSGPWRRRWLSVPDRKAACLQRETSQLSFFSLLVF